MTEKSERFCKEFMIDLNATQAAIRAGYSESRARVTASELLMREDVQIYIQKLKKEVSEKLDITHERITKEWSNIAFLNVGDYYKSWTEKKDLKELTPQHRSCIELIDTKTLREKRNGEIYDVEYVKVKFYDKAKALIELGKHVGYYEKENFQKKNEPRVVVYMPDNGRRRKKN